MAGHERQGADDASHAFRDSSAEQLDIHSTQDSRQFTLRGVGCLHAVGLCRTGATVMGERGYAHEEDSF